MKRELIDRNALYIPSDENEYDELVQFADDVMNAEVITEQEIVKPYLDKLKKVFEEYRDGWNYYGSEYERSRYESYDLCVEEVNDVIDTLVGNVSDPFIIEDGEEDEVK